MSPRSLLLASLAAMGLACTSAPTTSPQGCLPGASLACACTDGRTGAQVCGDDGRLSPCVCTGGDASTTLPDATSSDVPVSVDAPLGVDVPASPDAPVGVDVPASPDVPVSVDVPVSPDVPVSIDTPTPIDVPIATTGNPFDGARMYVNPDYTRAVQMSADLASASLRPTLACVGRYPTAIWIDRIAKVPEVTRHLDTALSEQSREGRPVVTTFVVYDLPGRDCAAHASNGELTISTADQTRYRTEYIDRIAAAFRAHPGQRIAAIIEPDSLPNLATNLSVPACAAAQNAYREGVAYAIRALALPNVSLYLDAAHAGWLGWPDNRTRAAAVYRSVLDAAGGVNLIRGFASNVSNYTVLREGPERFGWDSNPCHDETTYARLLGDALAAAGITHHDWIIDTSRNGRGNIRAQWGSWCNVQGAGLGERPVASPAPGLDAYLWVKPPGESDGTSDRTAARYDDACGNADATSGAPEAGTWFHSYFLSLVQNASPAVAACASLPDASIDAPTDAVVSPDVSVRPDVTVTPDVRIDVATADVPSAPTRPGFFHTQGAAIVDSMGRTVRLTGLSWFGFETANYAPHGLWSRSMASVLDQIRTLGYNTIRVPWCNQMLDASSAPNSIDLAQNADLRGLTALQILDQLIAGARARGLKVILDRHRPDSGSQSELWYTGAYDEARWIRDWVMLATRYRDDPTVIGFDLHNEPHGAATWGDGNMATDWRLAAERAGNAVLAVNPDLLIIVEGIERHAGTSYWWGGNLRGVRAAPVRLSVPGRVVYSPHDYPASVYAQTWFSAADYPANLPRVWGDAWGYIAAENIAPVWIGEFGTRLATTSDRQWLTGLVSYIRTNNLSFAFWCLNPNSGDTGGILQDDWRTVNTEKQSIVMPALAPLL